MSSGSRSNPLKLPDNVAKRNKIEGDLLETPRTGCSVFQQNSSKDADDMELRGVEVAIDGNDKYRTVHRIEKTPKPLAKKKKTNSDGKAIKAPVVFKKDFQQPERYEHILNATNKNLSCIEHRTFQEYMPNREKAVREAAERYEKEQKEAEKRNKRDERCWHMGSMSDDDVPYSLCSENKAEPRTMIEKSRKISKSAEQLFTPKEEQKTKTVVVNVELDAKAKREPIVETHATVKGRIEVDTVEEEDDT
uniref:Uncharacterized protein n=1 Tax=Caenorhabditis tropicalis TaxID=1561998 RepID=A0A1I7TMJ1_9PELO